jgi:hypothetical protein
MEAELGALNRWPLGSFVTRFAARFDISDFVETGTFKGVGCTFAAEIFPSVTTIEINEQYYESTRNSCNSKNIRFVLGDSATVLPEIVSNLTQSAMFWLDGHSGGGNFGPNDYCPLLAELDAIASSPFPHFILIDDARAFVAPPPPPFQPEKWPSIAEVIEAARRSFPYYCVIIADAIICVPPAAKAELVQFCQEVRPKI